MDEFETYTPTPEELAGRKRRNLMLGVALVAFVAIVITLTIVRLGDSVDDVYWRMEDGPQEPLGVEAPSSLERAGQPREEDPQR